MNDLIPAELHDLLDDLVWNTGDGRIREHENLAVMIDPLPGTTEDVFDVPVTVLPFEFSSNELEGTAITFTPIDGSGAANRIVGRLDRRGQALFRDLPSSRYTTDVLLPSRVIAPYPAPVDSVLQRIARLFRFPVSVPLGLSLRPQLMQASTTGSSLDQTEEVRFRDDSGRMLATVWTNGGDDLKVDLEVRDQAWDGKLMFLTIWGGPEPHDALASDHSVLIVPMAWSDVSQVCCGAVKLHRNDALLSVGLQLPEEPIPASALTDDLVATVVASVAAADSELTLTAWRRLSDNESGVAPEVRRALEQSLAV